MSQVFLFIFIILLVLVLVLAYFQYYNSAKKRRNRHFRNKDL